MSTYPPALRSIMKGVPAILIVTGFSYLGWIYMYSLIRHSQDHPPKHSYKSTKFEKGLRFRDEWNRIHFEQNMKWYPHITI